MYGTRNRHILCENSCLFVATLFSFLVPLSPRFAFVRFVVVVFFHVVLLEETLILKYPKFMSSFAFFFFFGFQSHCHRITLDYSSQVSNSCIIIIIRQKLSGTYRPSFSSTLLSAANLQFTYPFNIQTRKTFNEDDDNRNLISIRFCVCEIAKMLIKEDKDYAHSQ